MMRFYFMLLCFLFGCDEFVEFFYDIDTNPKENNHLINIIENSTDTFGGSNINSLGDVGDACQSSFDCISNICVDINGGTCTQFCDAQNPCPNGFECRYSTDMLSICGPSQSNQTNQNQTNQNQTNQNPQDDIQNVPPCINNCPEIDMVFINSGVFEMGGRSNSFNRPIHQVFITRPFEVSKTEITMSQYMDCVIAGVCSAPHFDDHTCLIWKGNGFEKDILPFTARTDFQPVTCINWYQARRFAKWMKADLLSEAQWEYVGRNLGKDVLNPWGNDFPSCEYAVMNEESDGCGNFQAWNVCSKPAGNTEQGVCDMLGNVAEWVLDEYHPDYRNNPPTDGSAWCESPDCLTDASGLRITRGGSWIEANHDYFYIANRYYTRTLNSGNIIGFRIARYR